jgi:hypothetical protein
MLEMVQQIRQMFLEMGSSELVRDDRTLALIVDTKVTTITMTAVEVMDTMVTIMLAVFLLAIVLIRGI